MLAVNWNAWLVLCLAATSVAAAAPAPGEVRERPDVVPHVYMVQLHDAATLGRRSEEHTHEAFARRALEKSVLYDVRFEFKDADLFYGLSVKVASNDSISVMQTWPEVANVWPVTVVPRPSAPIDIVSAEAVQALTKRSPGTEGVHQRQTGNSLDYNTAHSMTGVDRLHPLGIKGKGVKVAVIDTGVDYRHSALGGCFGSGCKISFGYDLVGDDYDGYTTPVPDDDPLVTCVSGGHGTHVLGILGMEVPSNAPNFAGLTGVAPEADFGMFRVFGCSGGVQNDILMSAMTMAANAGADIISMSIGESYNFGPEPNDPYSLLIQGLSDRGVAVVVAAGNEGAVSPFSIDAPANRHAAIAVGSVESTLFPVFNMEDTSGNVIPYGSVYAFPTNTELTVIVVGAGDVATELGCRAENYYVPGNMTVNKDDYVLVVRRGGCGLATIQTLAANAGFRNVLTYPGSEFLANPFLDGFTASLPANDSNGVPLNLGITTSQKLYEEGTKSSQYQVKFTDATPHMERQAWGGQMNNFSSAGPVWDFSLKPQITAPGGNILSTWPLEGTGFAVNSGTSMATPYLAGTLALLKTQFPDLSVPELIARLQTTAKPTIRATRDDLSPTVHQGAGLVDAHDAIFYRSFVSPGQLELGPTEQLASRVPTVTVSNPSGDTIQYTLQHISAPGMALYPHWDAPDNQGYTYSSLMRLDSLPFAATVEFPAGSTFTLAPGQSREVEIDIHSPEDLEPFMIPIYNGFIAISTDTGERYIVPYMGAAYNYTAAPKLGSDPVPSKFNFPQYPPLGSPQVFYNQVGIGNHVQGSFITMAIVTSVLQPSLDTRFDLVRAETDFVPTYYGFDPAVSVNYTKTVANTTGVIAGVEILGTNWVYTSSKPIANLIDSLTSPPMWDGATFSTPLPMPVGGYRLLMQVLKLNGDPDNRQDWTTWMSGVIEIMEEIPAY
ncbi:peptidase S8/S53 domain-containing protein [Hypoxylon fuscum]|nr:peptidase S8/S53 domain-containing protein [Hypoxylon fuscum]